MPAAKGRLDILHISDLHFGDHHIFRPPQPDDHFPTLASSLVKDIRARATGCAAICCVTGDLTQAHKDEEYAQAESALRTLASSPCFTRGLDDFFVIQGNHDVNYEAPDSFTRWAGWRNFLTQLRPGRPVPQDPTGLTVLHTEDQTVGAMIATLNSAVFVAKDDPDERDRGRLGISQLEALRAALEACDTARLRSSIRIAIVHHHPILIPSLREDDDEYDAIADSKALLALLREYGFHLVLHGHKHHPLVLADNTVSAYTADAPGELVVVSGGSVGSNELPRGPAGRNTYNWIAIKWVPEALQARVQIQTRALKTLDDRNHDLLPSQWSWETLKVYERVLTYGQPFPPIRSQTRREFTASADQKRERARRREYQRTRGNLAAVALVPSFEPGQVFEARVWLVHHMPRDASAESPDSYPVRVTWSAGNLFDVHTVERAEDPEFACGLHYYGPMLVQAEMEFPDGEVARVHVYVPMPSERVGS